MQRTIDIVNIFLGIAIIAILAAIAADSLSLRLGKSFQFKGNKEAAAPAPAIQRTEDLMYYAPIMSEGLFGRAAQGQLSALINNSATSQAGPLTAPAELLLLGTAIGSFRETFALVRNNSKQEERVFRLGEMVFDAGRLVQVTREQAFIVVNGNKVELLTPMTPSAASLPGRAEHPAPQAGIAVTSMGAGNYVIDQRALNAALDNPAQAMTDARLLPSQKDGKVEGFRASEVKADRRFCHDRHQERRCAAAAERFPDGFTRQGAAVVHRPQGAEPAQTGSDPGWTTDDFQLRYPVVRRTA